MVYSCSDCNGSFQNAGEFCAHYNECHGSKTSSSNVKSKKYQCNLCDYRSDRATDVKRHMKSKHRENQQVGNNGGNKGVVIPSNEQFGMNKGCDVKYDIRLKENFKLFVSDIFCV